MNQNQSTSIYSEYTKYLLIVKLVLFTVYSGTLLNEKWLNPKEIEIIAVLLLFPCYKIYG